MNKMQFTKEDLIGQVVYVDTNQVLVEVENDESINLLNVGSIVSIQTTRTYEFTIGLIIKIAFFSKSLVMYTPIRTKFPFVSSMIFSSSFKIPPYL